MNEHMSIPICTRMDQATIADLATGSAVLGTGGGGDPWIGRLMASQAIADYGEVEVIQPDMLDDDDLVVVVAMSGAPTVLVEKAPNGGELDVVWERVVEYAGRPARAAISWEIGGVNSLFPIAAAARNGVPLVDADGMGRAFPEFQITTLNVGGVKFGPRFVTDEKGNVLRIDGIDAIWLERINRRALVAMGGSVVSAIGLTGADIKRAAVHRSISLAVAIGALIRRGREEKTDWHTELRQICGAHDLFRGKIVSVERRTEGGWVRGHALIDGLDSDRGRQVRIDFQNEHLLARVGTPGAWETVLVSTPDLIAVLDFETGTPITTEGLRYGQRVTVIGIPCHPLWRTPRGLELAGPRYFRWSIEYVPLETVALG